MYASRLSRRAVNRVSSRAGLVLTIVPLLGLALSGHARAQQPPADLVPLKATMVAPLAQVQILTIPVDPPLLSAQISGSGEAPLLGAITYVEHHYTHAGVDGIPKSSTLGVGAMTAANGDALFFSWSGLLRTTATPGVYMSEDSFVITGGRGRFLGATGSGVLTRLFDPVDKKQVTFSWEGMVSRPKP
jgi:hypothetical protein